MLDALIIVTLQALFWLTATTAIVGAFLRILFR